MNTCGAKKILVGVTGATGMCFLQPFLNALAETEYIVHGICSDAGRKVLQMELNLTPEELPAVSHWFSCLDIGAAPASGSSNYESMVLLPCTMGSLAAVAAGMSVNLIHRAADVMLKERRKIVFAVRETPFNRTHLTNMLSVHDAGGVICPVMPSYYLRPKSIEEAVQTYVWRLADQIGINIPGRKRWETEI